MIIFIAPAYNEESNIGLLISEIDACSKKERFSYHLIIVDDGSRDRTAEIVAAKASAYPCTLITYKPNKGVGEAFRRGFHKALEIANDSDIVVTTEADRTADLGILKSFIFKIEQGKSLAVASYYAAGGSIKGTVWYRKLLSRAGNIFISTLFQIRNVHTFSSFYRAYRPEALKKVLSHYGDFFEEKGFACVVELLIRIHRLGLPIEEVPMVLQGSKRVGKSKMKVWQTIAGYLRISLRRAVHHA